MPAGTPAAPNENVSAASTPPRPPGVGTAEPMALATRKMNSVSSGLVICPNASSAAQNSSPVATLRISMPSTLNDSSLGLVSTSISCRA